ncbi:N-acetylmuramic acid 6-phosphate etherase [Mangrovivirga cuniculi]|uniref:N-acetylmuramic acid 6-phosphate etherase n=1 Tax=Mangrovivirga cuniculi TaxID=2715131 RepID=A0A4D7JL92_9BACT|nr:N-acetylmuramic acid 6-phosphate etherase [Mangrovivirga cuniculi]QCK13302.1 N-acetylmuramic acid 6-phosphate etherase [Mangrovivirga cuniculi]
MKDRTTESDSLYDNLENMPIGELLHSINREDKKVPEVVEGCIPQIEKIVLEVSKRMKAGGRLFYIGAGTSGRLGIVDASECPPTFGVSHDMVIGLIAGGDSAIRKAVEFAEDDTEQAWKDLSEYNIGPNDSVIGIAASGTTPYVIGGVKDARENGLFTGCITCNDGSPLAQAVEVPVEAVVGPEFVTGSTRMKAGTAQKLILNMISTGVMISLGRVKGNKMVDMQLSNDKLVERGCRMLMNSLNISRVEAQELLSSYGSVRKVIEHYKK